MKIRTININMVQSQSYHTKVSYSDLRYCMQNFYKNILYPIEYSGLELELAVLGYPSPVVSEPLPLLYRHWREAGQGTLSLWQLTLCGINIKRLITRYVHDGCPGLCTRFCFIKLISSNYMYMYLQAFSVTRYKR